MKITKIVLVACLLAAFGVAHAGVELQESANPVFKGRWYQVGSAVKVQKLPCCGHDKKMCKRQDKNCGKKKESKAALKKGKEIQNAKAAKITKRAPVKKAPAKKK